MSGFLDSIASAKVLANADAMRSCTRGNVATLFAFALIPMLGFVGAAIDYSRANSLKAKMQVAVDESALTIIGLPDDARLAQATNRALRVSPDVQDVQVAGDDDGVLVWASGRVETTVLKLLRIDEIDVSVRARAEKADDGPPFCIVALNRSVKDAISFSGSSSYMGRDCAVLTNSDHAEALTVSGSARPVAAAFCSAGGFSVPDGFGPLPRGGCRRAADPFAEIDRPSSAGCDFTNVSVQPNQTRTLQPGVYCGGLTVRGTAELEPGTYVFKNGAFSVNSQASLIGEGVHLHLTGTGAGFTINGGGNIELSAPVDGPYGGILISQDPLANPGAENKLNGGSSTIITGAIYTPTQAVRLNGSSGFGQSAAYMPIVSDTIAITGATEMGIDLEGVDMVAELPRHAATVRLVE